MSSRPTKSTANLLWGSCGGECANPDCDAPVLRVDQANKVVEKIGEIAHISGAKDGSNRYDANKSDEDRRHYDNLLILCRPCHREQPNGIDIPENEKHFPTALLLDWKRTHLEKIRQLNDRNWVCNPNAAQLYEDGKSISVKFWIDRKGHAQLYTAEQLVIVEQLFKLHLSFSQISEALKMIDQTEGKPIDPSHQTLNDATIGQLYQLSKRLPKREEYGWIGYLAESLQLAQDVTLGELYTMWVQDGLAKRDELRKQNRELLKQKAELIDPLPTITSIDAPDAKTDTST